jgi:hypothetical protein
MTELNVDPTAVILKHAVLEDPKNFLPEIKACADRALRDLFLNGRRPVMVQLTVQVAP